MGNPQTTGPVLPDGKICFRVLHGNSINPVKPAVEEWDTAKHSQPQCQDKPQSQMVLPLVGVTVVAEQSPHC